MHRNQFISDYLRGTIAFVDHYWRIIHKAAGWEALRYWLLVRFPLFGTAAFTNFQPRKILAFNQFLNGHDVAQVLLHYEDLAGTTP